MGGVQPTSVADKASLSDLRRSIRADLAAMGADPAIAFDCLVAVTEACAAALLGCDDGSEPPDISWEIEPGRACFRVTQRCARSRSQASHPSRASVPEGDPLEVVDDSGPIVLIRGLMDTVRVQDGPSARIVTLTKLLQ